MTMSTVVPSKSSGSFVIERVWAFMKELGIEGQDTVVKSDQEPSIKHLVDEIGRRKAEAGGRWIRENSPVDSHASNGVVERAIQSVQGQVRVMKGALEERWGVKIGSKHAVIPWIVEYAAHLLNRFEVSHDGKTAYERYKGKFAKHMGIEFGEGVLWIRRPIGGAMAKMTILWEGRVPWRQGPNRRIHRRRLKRNLENKDTIKDSGGKQVGTEERRACTRCALEPERRRRKGRRGQDGGDQDQPRRSRSGGPKKQEGAVRRHPGAKTRQNREERPTGARIYSEV